MKIISVVVILAFMTVLGCAGMSTTEQRTLSGGAIGAGGGAIIGAMAGNAGLGAAIGAGAGLAGGYIYDQNEKSKESAYREGYKAGQQSPK
jgi:hypothetical protein